MARSLFGHFALATLHLAHLVSHSRWVFFAYTYHLQSHSVILIVSLTTYTQPLCLIFATN